MEIAKSIKFAVTFLFFSAFIFSVGFSWGSVEAVYHFKTQTALCPQSEMQTGCPLISEHIRSMQGLFMAAVPDTRIALLLLFILSLLSGLAALGSSFKRRMHHQLAQIRTLFYSENPELPLFNHLQLAFARGILNPKIY